MKRVVAVGLSLVFAQASFAADPITRLESYGKLVASSTKQGAVTFMSAIKTTERPMRAYKLTFNTSAPELISLPNADLDQGAYITNHGKTLVWKAKFCTSELKAIMAEYEINLVSGDLQDNSGATQSLAACM